MQVVSWRQRPWGANYAGWADAHPLTPRYQVKPAAEVLSVHPQSGGIGYRHWLGLVLSDQTGLKRPARAIATWHDDRARDAGEGDARLLAAGYDIIKNMKARSFVESEMPLPGGLGEAAQARLDDLASRLVRAADQVADLLRRAVRDALFSVGASVKLDWELLASQRERFWERTDAAFFAALEREARHDAATAPDAALSEWLKLLRDTALALFDEAAPVDPDLPPMPKTGEGAPRLIQARRRLRSALHGYGKEGAALFGTLALAAPAQKPKKGKAA